MCHIERDAPPSARSPTQAIKIIEEYEKTLEGVPENEYEHSEMLLYKVRRAA